MEALYDGADCVSRQLDNMEDEELDSILADINFDEGQFARQVKAAVLEEKAGRKRLREACGNGNMPGV